MTQIQITKALIAHIKHTNGNNSSLPRTNKNFIKTSNTSTHLHLHVMAFMSGYNRDNHLMHIYTIVYRDWTTNYVAQICTYLVSNINRKNKFKSTILSQDLLTNLQRNLITFLSDSSKQFHVIVLSLLMEILRSLFVTVMN